MWLLQTGACSAVQCSAVLDAHMHTHTHLSLLLARVNWYHRRFQHVAEIAGETGRQQVLSNAALLEIAKGLAGSTLHTHSLSHSLTYTLTHSLTHSLTHGTPCCLSNTSMLEPPSPSNNNKAMWRKGCSTWQRRRRRAGQATLCWPTIGQSSSFTPVTSPWLGCCCCFGVGEQSLLVVSVYCVCVCVTVLGHA